MLKLTSPPSLLCGGQKQDSATLDMERANKEMEVLRKQYEAMSQELKEVTQEAEVAKCRRDWAFQERDKIVAERESIRYTNGAIEKQFLACFVVMPVDSLGWFGFVWCLVGKCSKIHSLAPHPSIPDLAKPPFNSHSQSYTSSLLISQDALR